MFIFTFLKQKRVDVNNVSGRGANNLHDLKFGISLERVLRELDWRFVDQQ